MAIGCVVVKIIKSRLSVVQMPQVHINMNRASFSKVEILRMFCFCQKSIFEYCFNDCKR